MVSISEDLLALIDAEVKRRGTNRSAFLATAAQSELIRPNNELVTAAIARSERRFHKAGSFESADVLRADRDARR
jgi:hypothetical protein